MSGIKNVVLVHGAWADGSSWSNLFHDCKPRDCMSWPFKIL
jgi:hypothetical protein